MLKAVFTDYKLNFLKPCGTSRGILSQKPSWFLKVWDINDSSAYGIGECAPIEGLSIDPISFMNQKLKELTENINNHENIDLKNYPSIQFGLETALLDLKNGGEKVIFKNQFTKGHQEIYINGLIWMGDKAFMLDQISRRLEEGFTTLKMKVGALDWATERVLLEGIRNEFSPDELTLRVDANGAFTLEEALEVDQVLAGLAVHSIEQPMAVEHRVQLAHLVRKAQTPVALDESLIGLVATAEREQLLDEIRPTYIILKPSFIGGWRGADEWIALAESRGIQWWATSALESNLGMNAIAQWAATKNNGLPQGLGTGSLYSNNLPAPHRVVGGQLQLVEEIQESWDLRALA